MGPDGGRRIFLLALLACLGLLAFLFARRSVDADMAFDRSHPRINQGLYLTVDDDSVATVGGEGKLYRADMAALLRGAGLRESTVTDIIVGEGITEIGYACFDDYDRLRSLKLGEGVVRISTGGLKNCPELEYLYYPAGLKDIGLDFLYECKNCVVVTPGEAAELPELANVRQKKRILEGVDSLEALSAASGSGKLPVGVSRWWRA